MQSIDYDPERQTHGNMTAQQGDGNSAGVTPGTVIASAQAAGWIAVVAEVVDGASLHHPEAIYTLTGGGR